LILLTNLANNLIKSKATIAAKPAANNKAPEYKISLIGVKEPKLLRTTTAPFLALSTVNQAAKLMITSTVLMLPTRSKYSSACVVAKKELEIAAPWEGPNPGKRIIVEHAVTLAMTVLRIDLVLILSPAFFCSVILALFEDNKRPAAPNMPESKGNKAFFMLVEKTIIPRKPDKKKTMTAQIFFLKEFSLKIKKIKIANKIQNKKGFMNFVPKGINKLNKGRISKARTKPEILPITVKRTALEPKPSCKSLCPGRTHMTTAGSGAPRKIEGRVSRMECVTAIAQ